MDDKQKRDQKVIAEALGDAIRRQVIADGFAYVHPSYAPVLGRAIPSDCKVATQDAEGFFRIERTRTK